MKQYLAIFLVVVSGALSPFFFYAYRSGEYMPLTRIVEIQKANKPAKKVLYGTALKPNDSVYKMTLLQMNQPQVVALGSSRVLEFREQYFNSSFVNLGRAMETAEAIAEWTTEIISKKPELVILGLDFWWFNKNRPVKAPPLLDDKTLIGANSVSMQDMSIILDKIIGGAIDFKDIARTSLLGRTNLHVGIRGQFLNGFGPDGSIYRTQIIAGELPPEGPDFAFTRRHIATNSYFMVQGQEIRTESVEAIVAGIRALESANIAVAVFLPPIATAILEELRTYKEEYAYFFALKSEIARSIPNVLDFTDPALFAGSDCEFIDGLHGGEILYLRILNELAKANSTVLEHLDIDLINRSIESNSGRTFVPDEQITTKKEIDFLGIGCSKD